MENDYKLNQKDIELLIDVLIKNQSVIFDEMGNQVHTIADAINQTKILISDLKNNNNLKTLEKQSELLKKIGNHLDREIIVMIGIESNEKQPNEKEKDQDKNKFDLKLSFKDTLENLNLYLFIKNEFLSFAETLHCFTDESIHKLSSIIENQSNLSLHQVSSKIKEMISMSLDELYYFKEIRDSLSIFEYKYFNWSVRFFTEQIGTARSNLTAETHTYGLGVLNNLENAYYISRPFIAARASENGVDIKDLCFQVQQQLSSGNLKKKLNSFKEVLSKSSEISMWFGLMEDSPKFVKTILEKGYFISCLSSFCEKGKLLFYLSLQNDEDLTKDRYISDIDDIIQEIQVFHEKDAEEITEILSIAKSIHKLRLHLQKIGHPDYQENSMHNSRKNLNKPGELKINYFKKLKCDLKN